MIGVVGGNGVAATNKLCQLIEERLTKNGAYRDAHHPEMLIWQATQAPSRSMYLEGRGPSWIEDYIEIGKKLKACGCTELCMCCNTAHYAIDMLSREINIPFINLLDLVAREVQRLGVKRVGMMCSDGLRKVGLYDERFAVFAPETTLVYPNESMQRLVTKGICNAKNSIRFSDKENKPEHPYNCFDTVCKYLLNEECVDCIVAGCTDICNVFTLSEYSRCFYVDSLQVLADFIVQKFSSNCLR